MSCVIVLVFQVGFLANSQTFRVSLASFHTEVANHYIQLSIKEDPHYMTIFQEKIRQFGILQFNDAITHNSHNGINTFATPLAHVVVYLFVVLCMCRS